MRVPSQYDSFETEVLKSDKPVLLEFRAEWSGPSKSLAPLLDEDGERLTVASLDIDQNPLTPSRTTRVMFRH